MDNVRVAVIGTGHLGSIHAKIYKETPNCTLVGVCDIEKTRLREISGNLGVPGYLNHKELFDKVDAVSIVTPTNSHFRIASEFLRNNIHTLVEKPFTSNLKEANRLIKTARKKKLTLQVGHVERFNSAFGATLKHIRHPQFIECHRLNPFPNRSLDVGVVLDLMIHDIDIVLGLVNSKVKRVEAVGVPVLTPYEDIANCRITFKNGCIANLTASRVSDEMLRKIRIFQKDTYISLDYREAKANVYRKEGLQIIKEELPIEKEQPLQKELAAFIDCVIRKTEPLVTGSVARDALAVALQAQKQIWKRNR